MKRYLIEVLLSVKDKEKGEWKFTIKFGNPLKTLSTTIYDDIKEQISDFKKDSEWESLADLYVAISKWILEYEKIKYENLDYILNSKGVYDIYVDV